MAVARTMARPDTSLTEQLISALTAELRELELAGFIDTIAEGAVVASVFVRDHRVSSVELRVAVRHYY